MSDFVTIQGMKIEVERRGTGSPLLLLLSEESQRELGSPFVEELAKRHELIIAQPPGFGRSERPDWISSPDDISYIFLDLIEALGLKNIPIVGLGLGGWIASEIAIKDDSFISKLVLVNSFGVKIGGPLDRDVQDIWTLHPQAVAKLKWRDVEKSKRDYSKMNDDQLAVVARNTESFARFCWSPYMHNPKLKLRLHRVKCPTLFVWGADDGIITPAYGKAYAALVPGARFETIADAGHYPHLEQPDAFAKIVSPFLG
jgi:pimeloyl-ACP methyl ester carboxylesterase